MTFEKIKQKYIATFSQKQQHLQAAWDNKDITQLHDLLHKLAGSSGGYGFDKLSVLCRQGMETIVNNKIVDECQFKKYYKEICLTLKAKHQE